MDAETKLFELHPLQEGIYFDQLITPSSPKYNIGGYIIFKGNFSEDTFVKALRIFYKKNKEANIRIKERDGMPKQEAILDLPLIDSKNYMNHEDPKGLANTFMRERMNAPFHLNGSGLIEQVLIRVDDGEYWFFLKQHHISSDAYSFSLRFKKITNIYNSLLDNNNCNENSSEHSYRDEVYESLLYKKSNDYFMDREYWMEKFSDSLESCWIESSTKNNRVYAQNDIDSDVLNRVKKFCESKGVTINSVLIAISISLLFKITGKKEYCAGVPVHNRVYRKQKKLFGMLASIVPSRISLSFEDTMLDLCKALKRNVNQDIIHRRFPWSEILNSIRSVNPGIKSIFDFTVDYEPFIDSPSVRDADVSLVRLISEEEDLPLCISIFDNESAGKSVISANCFDSIMPKEILQKFVNAFEVSLDEIASHFEENPIHFTKIFSGIYQDGYKEYLSSYVLNGFNGLLLDNLKSDDYSVKKITQMPLSSESFDDDVVSGFLALEVLIYNRNNIRKTVFLSISEVGLKNNFLSEKPFKTSHTLVSLTLDLDADVESEKSKVISFFNRFELEQSCFHNSYLDVGLEKVYDVGKAEVSERKIFAFWDEKENSIPILLVAEKLDSSLIFKIAFNRNTLDDASGAVIARQFDAVFNRICNSYAGDQIKNLEVDDQRNILKRVKEFNGNTIVKSQKMDLIDLFSDSVSAMPDKTAIIVDDKDISYQSLYYRASYISQMLFNDGVKPDDRVAILTGRTVDYFTSILSINALGAVYIPLDRDTLKNRIFDIIDDIKPKIIICDNSTKELCDDLGERFVNIDDNDNDNDNARSNIPLLRYGDAQIRKENLAYIIYTSGTTGKPKGVKIGNDGLRNTILDNSSQFLISSDSKFLHSSSMSFDAGSWVFWMSITSGATLVINEDISSVSRIKENISKHNITHIMLTPSVLDLLHVEDTKSLSCVIVGGETCSPALADRWNDKVNFFNAYGPTEISICATIFKSDPGSKPNNLIGKPISNTKIYIVRQGQKLCDIGQVGDIYIGGIGLSSGYQGMPELTNQSFVGNFIDGVGKLYKTGDIGKWSHSGDIEYIGRADDQINLRGIRVELDDIKNNMLSMSEVSGAVVVVEHAESGPVICSYVVECSDSSSNCPIEQRVRSYLSMNVPSFMVPSVIKEVKKIPLKLSGKVDTSELKTLLAKNEYSPPQTNTEKCVCQVVEEVLNIKHVSILSSFFEIGGSSIEANIVIARISSLLSKKIDLKSLLGSNRLQDFCKYIESLPYVFPEIIQLEKNNVSNIPLTHQQRKLWFAHKLNPSSSEYNVSAVIRIKGYLDHSILENSFNDVVDRHESFRTIFMEDSSGNPLQNIVELNHNYFSFKDLSSIEGELQDVQEYDLIHDNSAKPFKLDQEIPIRIQLLKKSNIEHTLCLAFHHICCDEWSLQILAQDIGECYNSRLINGCPSNNGDKLRYRDYACWQISEEIKSQTSNQKSHWLEKLKNIPAVHSIPLDYPRTITRNRKAEFHREVIQLDIAKKFRSMLESNNASLYMGMYSVLSILIWKLSRGSDIVVGCPTTNRRQEVANVIGFFLNTIILKVNVSENLSFLELLEQSRLEVLGSFEYQDFPFDEMVDQLCSQRDTSYNPLFQIMLVSNDASQNFEISGLETKYEPIRNENSKFDLLISFTNDASGIAIDWEYDSSIFDSFSIESYARAMSHIISIISDKPSIAISNIAAVSKEELDSYMEKFVALYHYKDLTHSSIYEMYEEMASCYPDDVALKFKQEELTNAELVRKSNGLANYLSIECGVKKGDYVAIRLNPSLDLIISILAVLRIGAIYVPLDPEIPKKRFDHIVESTGLRLVISNSSYVEINNDARFVEIDLGPQGLWDKVDSYLSVEGISYAHIKQDDPAYLIFTSGSTGTPKGVLQTHRTIVNLINNSLFSESLDRGINTIQCTAPTFDVSLQEIFTSLLTRGYLLIIQKETKLNPELFLREICSNNIGRMFCTPTYLSVFISHAIDTKCGELPISEIVSAGEKLNLTDDQRIFLLGQGIRLINHYGPTETHVVTALDVDLNNKYKKISIGQPIQNTECAILDDYKNPVPIGVVGELYFGGFGLAREYIGGEKSANDRFETSISYPTKNKRLYRSGDLGRYLENGEIEIIGRSDQQIKIRGYRVEKEEVRLAYLKNNFVDDCIITTKENSGRISHLVAHLKLNQERILDFDKNKILEFIDTEVKTILPSYMVPTYVLEIDEIPYTKNGKVDYSSLPAFDIGLSDPNKNVLPATDLERLVHKTCCQVLEIEDASMGDNFFSLGGHSLLIMKFISIMQSNGFSVTVQTVYNSANLFDIAEKISDAKLSLGSEKENIRKINNVRAVDDLNEGELKVVTKHLPGGADNVQSIYALSPMQSGMFYHHLVNKDKQDPYLLCLWLKAKNERSRELFLQAWNHLIDKHEPLRTFFCWEGIKDPIQVVSKNAEFFVEDITVPEDVDIKQHLKNLFKSDIYKMSLSVPPLVRGYRSDHKGEAYVGIQIHHMITDHIGLEIIFREISEFLSSEELQKQPEGARYSDYITEVILKSGDNGTDLFFNKLLGDIFEPSVLLGKEQVLEDGNRTDTNYCDLDNSLSKKIRLASMNLKITPAAIFHAAWSVLVSKYTGLPKAVFGSVFSGRLNSNFDLSNLVGLTINTLPFAINTRTINAEKLVKEAHQLLIELVQYEHVSLVDTQRYSQCSGNQPLFNSILNYRHSDKGIVIRQGELPAMNGFELAYMHERSNYPISISIDDWKEGFSLSLQLENTLAEYDISGAYFETLNVLTDLLLSNSKVSVEEISIVSESERKELLNDLSGRENDCTPRYIKDAFKEQVSLTPSKVAVRSSNEYLSFFELDKLSDSIAYELYKKLPGVPSLVAVYMARSVGNIASIMSVFKSGLTYLPIDPSLPKERIRLIIDDAKPAIILSDNEYVSVLNENNLDANVLNIDNLAKLDDNYRSFRKINPCDAAYMIYTSGTTGKPKGSIVTYANFNNFISSFNRDILAKLDAKNWGLNASMAFDASLQSIAALVNGYEITLIPECHKKDPDDFIEFVTEKQVDVVDCTPSQLAILLDCKKLKSEEFNGINWIVGGENISQKLWEKISSYVKKYNLLAFNIYGPTECTIDSTFAEINALSEPSIGKPLENTKVYILDENRNLLPKGAQGELYLGGLGVSLGYLNRLDMTEKYFSTNPFHTGNMYRSGDHARFKSCGDLCYLGRKDNQVKIRGHRIEIGEIESVLSSHKFVSYGIVVCDETSHGDKRLLAYYIREPDVILKDAEMKSDIRTHLARKLPKYMVPSFYCEIDNIPKTVSGKVNRSELPDISCPKNEVESDRPVSQLQSQLIKIWCDTLSLNHVGLDDAFFEVGGDSISAVRLSNQILNELGYNVSIVDILENPTIVNLSEHIAKLDKSELVYNEISTNAEHRYSPFPLTEIQKAYWAGRQDGYELGNISTHAYIEIPVKDLLVDRVGKAINRLVCRHDMLRMVMTEDNQQLVIPKAPYYKLKVYDLSECSSVEEDKLFKAVRNEMSHQKFECTSWPMFDFRVSVKKSGSSIIHYSMDALALDASSSMVLFNEFRELYSNPTAEMPKLEIQFRDYVLEKEKFKNTPTYQQSKQYWSDRALDFPGKPSLPLKSDPSSIKAPKFERRSGKLDKQSWLKLCSIAKQSGITPTVLFLGCFSEVLARWSLEKQFTINLTLFNRYPFHNQINDVLGDFTTLTLLEVDGRNDNNDFKSRLQKLQSQLWNDLENRHFDGVEMMKLIRQKTGQSSNYPIVVTSTIGLSSFDDTGNDSSIKIDRTGEDEDSFGITQTPQVWLDVQVVEQSGELVFNWDSVVGLFPDGLLDDMFSAFNKIFLDLSLSDRVWSEASPVKLPSYQQELVENVNDTKIDSPAELIHSGILRQFNDNPEKLAIFTRSRKLTFLDLDLISQKVASQLTSNYIHDGELVAVLMEKGWEQIISVLGILRAGGAYLPIDATLPDGRINKIIEISGAKKIITLGSYERSFPDNVKSFNLDNIEKMDSVHWSDGPSSVDNLAYVIYTSGSTGTPKGVMISHKSAINTIYDINKKFEVSKSDTVFALSNINFDLSVYDIFGVLGVGGSLVIPRTEEYKNPQEWINYFNGKLGAPNITIWNTVPALMQMLIKQLESVELNLNIRLSLLSGDWIPLSLPERIKKFIPCAKVVSLGGATEVSIWSIYHTIGQVNQEMSSIPYGKPLSNQSFYILDANMNESPLWVPGNLYIGGVGLSLGYLGDELTTKRSFISHPQTGEIIYKTGDKGRWLSDGNIEFLGRDDFQVKIQGYRIELGEIEASINKCPKVSESVVSTVEIRGVKHLCAHIVPARTINEDESVVDELKNHLRSLLPNYMVPKYYMLIEEIPLSANGKVDIKSLPLLDLSKENSDFEKPRDTLEIILCDVWAKSLNNPNVGISDNFFQLGGDSLLVLEFTSRMHELGINVFIEDVLENPTIINIADKIRATSNKFSFEPYNYIEGQDIYSPPNRQLLYRYVFGNHWNVSSILCIKDLCVTSLQKAIDQMMKVHSGLRHTFSKYGDRVIEYILPEDSRFIIEEYDFSSYASNKDKSDKIESIAQTYQRSLKLDSELVKFAVFKYGDNEPSRFFWLLHHALLDGYSTKLFLKELMTRYFSIKHNQKFDIRPPTSKISEWGNYLYQYVNGPQSDSEIDFWLSQPYQKANKIIDFPDGLSKNRSCNFDEHGDGLYTEIGIGKYYTDKVFEARATNKYVLSDIIFTAIANAISIISKSEYAYFNMTNNARAKIFREIDLANTIGWLTSEVPIFVKTNLSLSREEQVNNFKRQYSQIPHSGIGFAALSELSEESNIRRKFSDLPEPEFKVNYLPPAYTDIGVDSNPGIAKISADTVWRAPESAGDLMPSNSGVDCSSYLEIGMDNENLRLLFHSRDNIFREETADKLLSLWRHEMIALIDTLF